MLTLGVLCGLLLSRPGPGQRDRASHRPRATVRSSDSHLEVDR